MEPKLEMAKIYQPSKPPPPNFTYIESEKRKIYLQSSPMKAPELNVNEYEYLFFDDVQGYLRISKSNIADLILTPNDGDCIWFEQRERNGIYMQIEEAETLHDVLTYYPAHVPNTTDLVLDVHNGFWVFLKWLIKKEDFPTELIIPRWATWILDPKVVVPKSGSIRLLRTERVSVLMGTHTSALHVLHVMAMATEIKVVSNFLIHQLPSTDLRKLKFNCLNITPLYVQSEVPFPTVFEPHTPIVIWNCKSAARPSFAENLMEIIQIHDPKVMFILEGRCYEDMFWHTYRKIPAKMRWTVIDPDAVSGGVIVLWDEFAISVEVDEIQNGEKPKFSASIKPREGILPRRLFC